MWALKHREVKQLTHVHTARAAEAEWEPRHPGLVVMLIRHSL